MDSYQPIYDAVRSRISGGDVGSVIERVAYETFDISHVRALAQQEVGNVGNQWSRPSVVFRPELFPDGTLWCALLGENLQEGVAGFGEAPEEAMAAFDRAFLTEKTPDAIRNEAADTGGEA